MEPNQAEYSVGPPSQIGQEASVLTSCFWCEELHRAKHPLSVCPDCVEAYRARRYPMVSYVGRSDSDVKRRLHEWVGTPSRYVRSALSTQAPGGSGDCLVHGQ